MILGLIVGFLAGIFVCLLFMATYQMGRAAEKKGESS